MFVQRSVFALARRAPVRAVAKRSFSTSFVRFEAKSKWDPQPGESARKDGFLRSCFPKVSEGTELGGRRLLGRLSSLSLGAS
ncbi:hypothetical protein TEQG_08755, partial [Trichophyton equinum CBS 127.97]